MPYRCNVLLIEDNPVDADFIREALTEIESNIKLDWVEDGEAGINFLFQHCYSRDTDLPCPDLILLDLNLPKLSGREVLEAIKGNPDTKHIPVIILTTSSDPRDVIDTYSLHANCFVTKPADLDEFTAAVKSIREFWTRCASLPSPG
jgi:chemotaxis family two-component system response regulator Rcp1